MRRSARTRAVIGATSSRLSLADRQVTSSRDSQQPVHCWPVAIPLMLRTAAGGTDVKTPGFTISESPSYVGRGVAALARSGDACRWADMIISARDLADAYDVTGTAGGRPAC
jgi:hypothetical protein